MRKVVVLLSTYNGEKYLKTQIDSVLEQENVEVILYVRDDGSKDQTQNILQQYSDNKKLVWYTGNNMGAANSFYDLIQQAPDGDYYAYCDQDDYWKPEKLSKAVELLDECDSSIPCLYHSKFTLVDKDLIPISPYRGNESEYVADTMKRAIISGRATGCTMVFNKKLVDFLRLYHGKTYVIHDNWTHKVCVALGGKIVCDKNSYILYRQHGNNTVGVSRNLITRIKRNYILASKRKCYTSNAVKALVEGYGSFMPPENLKICNLVANYHEGFNRFKIIRDKGFHTDWWKTNVKFALNVLIGVF